MTFLPGGPGFIFPDGDDLRILCSPEDPRTGAASFSWWFSVDSKREAWRVPKGNGVHTKITWLKYSSNLRHAKLAEARGQL
jgi:hypothetical protein